MKKQQVKKGKRLEGGEEPQKERRGRRTTKSLEEGEEPQKERRKCIQR